MSESSDTEQEIVSLTDSPTKVSDTECISTVFRSLEQRKQADEPN